MINAIKAAKMIKTIYGDKLMETTLKSVVEKLPLDRETSGIDLLVLLESDLHGMGNPKKKLFAALDRKHPSVSVILLCTPKSKVKELMHPNMDVYNVKQFNTAEIASVVDSALQNLGEITEKETEYTTKDLINSGARQQERQKVSGEIIETQEEEKQEGRKFRRRRAQKDITNEEILATTEPQKLDVPDLPPAYDVPQREQQDTPQPLQPVEPTENIKPTDVVPYSSEQGEIQEYRPSTPLMDELATTRSWESIKEAAKKDQIINDLLKSSTVFNGTITMLNNIENEIASIFLHEGLNANEKFQAIRTLGVDKSVLQEKKHNLIVDHTISVINAITEAAQRNLEREIQDIKKSLKVYTISMSSVFKTDSAEYTKLINDRLALQDKLNGRIRDIQELFLSIDGVTREMISDFDKGLPSDSVAINEVMPIRASELLWQGIFDLTKKFNTAIQKDLNVFEKMEDSIDEVMQILFTIIQTDATIISSQDQMIRMLKARNIEDTVKIDSVLKPVLRVYTGREGSGVLTTVINKSRVAARSRNVLVIKIGNKDDLITPTYGETFQDLSDFDANDIQSNIDFVSYDTGKLYTVGIVLFLEALTKYSRHYREINLIMDKDNKYFKEIIQKAISVTYITDCTTESLDYTKEAYQFIVGNITNVAHILCAIGAPTDMQYLLEYIGAQNLNIKIIALPYLEEIKVAALKNRSVFDTTRVQVAYEECFR